MTTTKKAYVGLIAFLEKNKNKKVETILDQIKEMTQQKNTLKTFLVNEKNEVVAIFCWYHKQFELLETVEYGAKASSATGFNTMCKVGVSKWTKQNKNVKAVEGVILAMLENETIIASEISDKREHLVAEAKMIDVEDMPIGYETIDDIPEEVGAVLPTKKEKKDSE